ncbi:MAG: type III polyketide synthase [Phycisphaerales bacterium]
MSARVLGLGTAVPTGRLEQSTTAETAARLAGAGDKAGAVRALFRRSGVEERRSVLATESGAMPFFEGGRVPTTAERMAVYAREAPGLAARACVSALGDAGVDSARVTHLVVVSCTGFESPGVDLELMERLGLGAGVRRTIVGMMGCHGAINGLGVARAFAAESDEHVVLMVCVELCTLHFCASVEQGAMVANALFADGAAACVIAQGESGHELVSCSSVVVPGTRADMGWVIGDAGFEMTLASGVPSKLAERTPGWVDGWLSSHGLTRGDVAGWAVHPGGPRVLDEVGAALELDERALDVSREVLRTRGNMSSGTVLFILEAMRNVEGPIAVLAFGPGLCAEGTLFV